MEQQTAQAKKVYFNRNQTFHLTRQAIFIFFVQQFLFLKFTCYLGLWVVVPVAVWAAELLSE